MTNPAYLLDTCTFLWYCIDSPSLSTQARQRIRSPEHDIYLSSVSSWEISVKYRLGRLRLPLSPERYIPAIRDTHHIHSLSLDEEATLYLPKLPDYHRDPFDRMLVCQGIVTGMEILTPDDAISQYPIKTLW